MATEKEQINILDQGLATIERFLKTGDKLGLTAFLDQLDKYEDDNNLKKKNEFYRSKTKNSY